jgi:hypothetical protein
MKIPATMKAAVLFGPNDMRVVEKKVPKPGQQEVLIKVEAVPSAEPLPRSSTVGRVALRRIHPRA